MSPAAVGLMGGVEGVSLVDIGLPLRGGAAVAPPRRDGPDLRLIAVTGYGQETDRRLSAEAGFDGHLVEPVHLDDLARALAVAGSFGALPAIFEINGREPTPRVVTGFRWSPGRAR
jgi:CheY-like chemotaxis protein